MLIVEKPPLARHHHPQRGWNLPELLVVLALVAWGAQAATTSWQRALSRMQALAARDQLMLDLQAARLQARQSARVLLLQARTDCAWRQASASDWSCGWQLVDKLDQTTLRTTPLAQGLQVRYTKSVPLEINERAELGQIGDRWTVQAHSSTSNDAQDAYSICLSGAGRLRAVMGSTCA